MSTNNEKLLLIITRMKGLYLEVSAMCKKLDADVKDLNYRFNNTEKTVNGINIDYSHITKTVNDLQRKVEALTELKSDLKIFYNDVTDKLANFKEQQKALNTVPTEMMRLKDKYSALTRKVNELDSTVEEFSKAVTVLNQDLNARNSIKAHWLNIVAILGAIGSLLLVILEKLTSTK